MSGLKEETNKPMDFREPQGQSASDAVAAIITGGGGAVNIVFPQDDTTRFTFTSAATGAVATSVNMYFGDEYFK
jgi:hypothetical protein